MFSAGDAGVLGNSHSGLVHWRVVEGYKKAREGQDLRLDISTDGQTWAAVPMALAAIQDQFYCENEDRLYPQSMGFEGRKKFTGFIDLSRNEGWDVAVTILEGEKARARC